MGSLKNGASSKMTLPVGHKLAYGVGHVLNDLCSSMWFTYLLIFFSKVELFSNTMAGAILLVGQIADGVATPFVGYFSDRGGDSNFSFCRYGRRKIWHLFGTVCVALSFPFIFTPCIGCKHSDNWAQMIYYCAFVVIFQIGWASTQISHLSLVPELTPDEHERTSLLAIRYSFTVISSMFVYLLLWAVFQTAGGDPNNSISPDDAFKFQIVAYMVVGVGALMSLIFHIGTKEGSQESLIPEEEKNSGRPNENTGPSTLSIFTQLRLYQVAVLYMATRLFANLSQTIFPLYLHDYLKLGGQYLAILPLVMYALGFLMSMFIKPLNKTFGRKIAYCFGAAIGIGVSLWVLWGGGNLYKTYHIYIVAGLYGIASTSLLVTSLGITADLIGQDLNNGAFIYGLMSLTDKLSNGAFVMAIQYCEKEWGPIAYRDALAYSCGGAALLGSIAVISLCNTPDTVDEEPVTSQRGNQNTSETETVNA